MNPQKDARKDNDPPPSYDDVVPLGLSFTGDTGHDEPLTLIMKGDYRTPDFEVLTEEKVPLFQIETESTLVYHVTYIKDLRPGGPDGIAHTIKRKCNGNVWRYTALAPGKDSVRYLEIETTPKISTKASTRLVFRSSVDNELDALHMNSEVYDGIRRLEVVYRGRRTGEIKQVGSDKEPKFSLVIEVAGIDPLLFVCFALVLDDRLMTSRRRLRRPLGSGFAGIGKGPGAGLAGAYAIGAGF